MDKARRGHCEDWGQRAEVLAGNVRRSPPSRFRGYPCDARTALSSWRGNIRMRSGSGILPNRTSAPPLPQ
eukprot:12915644-Prorocentrum_lima.AAC.1